MKNFILVLILFLVSCSKTETPITSPPCPEGFCGADCEFETSPKVYGNYTGLFICEGDTITKSIGVVERYKPSSIYIPEKSRGPCRPIIEFNQGEIHVLYWKSYMYSESGGYLTDEPDILIQGNHQSSYYPVKSAGWGYLTKDSLFFWFYSYNPKDTCFYFGRRR